MLRRPPGWLDFAQLTVIRRRRCNRRFPHRRSRRGHLKSAIDPSCSAPSAARRNSSVLREGRGSMQGNLRGNPAACCWMELYQAGLRGGSKNYSAVARVCKPPAEAVGRAAPVEIPAAVAASLPPESGVRPAAAAPRLDAADAGRSSLPAPRPAPAAPRPAAAQSTNLCRTPCVPRCRVSSAISPLASPAGRHSAPTDRA